MPSSARAAAAEERWHSVAHTLLGVGRDPPHDVAHLLERGPLIGR
jgi:hypothetical protein